MAIWVSEHLTRKSSLPCPNCGGEMTERQQQCLTLRRPFIVVDCARCGQGWDRDELQKATTGGQNTTAERPAVMSDIVKRLRAWQATSNPLVGEELTQEAADEIERLRERCEAYKGQVLAGSQEIERLRTALGCVD